MEKQLPKTESQLVSAARTSGSAVLDPPQSTIHPNLILAICCTSLLIVGMDVTIVNVALPAIQKDLHARLAGLQWILDAYTLVVASFLMLAGSMSDRFGRRRVFQIGLGVFTLGSLLCSRAATIEQLIGFRAVQGLGAAFMLPAALSIVMNMFQEGADRNRALGIWGGLGAAGATVGLIAGGFLTRYAGWQYIFYLNVPIGVLALALTRRVVPESRLAEGLVG